MSHPKFIAERHPDRPAYIMAETGKVITYSELDESSNQVAHLFRQNGVHAGQNIAVFMENREEFVPVVWGAQRSGLVFTTISTHLKAQELAYILIDSESKVLFTSEQLKTVVDNAIATDERLSQLVVVNVDDQYKEHLSQFPTKPIDDECAGRELLYSSGTTGRPKGVEVEQAGSEIDSMIPALHGLKKLFGFNEETVYLSPAPLYHAAPLRFVMLTMFEGGTVVVMEKFEPEAALGAIETHRVTHSQWVPIMFSRFLNLPEQVREQRDLSSMKVAVHAAAPCPKEVKQQMLDWWGDIIYEYYGSTEAIGLTVISPQEWREKPGSVGRAIIGKPRIVNPETQTECNADEIGDVYFSDGPGVAYRNDPKKTAEAKNEQGWYGCGDVGYLDADGYLYLSDRRDFMIISGGVNIYPQETENTLVLHPAVDDAAVFGVPNEEFGQEVKAVVQLHDGQAVNAQLEQTLIEFCRERLSAIKCPRSVDFVAQLPRMENGKLYKKTLVAQYS